MKIKIILSFIIMTLTTNSLLFNKSLLAQTTGTLTVHFTTSSSGGYSPKNLLAAWIETSSGTFIKTKFKYCKSSNLNHLSTWTSKSGSNTTDAVTGSTRTSNGALSFIWDGTDVSAAIVTDGPYKVWLEFAWAENSKTVQSFSFAKGISADHQTPASTTNFSGITLDWVPTNMGISDNQNKSLFSIYPNPITNQSTINYTLNYLSDVTISIYDINGKLINVLVDENQIPGTYSLPLLLKEKAGIYFVKLYTGKTQQIQRILISE